MKPLLRRVYRLATLCVSGLLLFTLFTGCALNPVTGRSELALHSMSSEQEIQLGKGAFRQAIQQNGGVYPDEKLAAYVSMVGQRLARRSHRSALPFRFVVVNDSAPNAFALPGGYVAITRGLLVNLTNEAELAAVLGHEIGHVTARHSLQGQQRTALLGTGVGILGRLADAAGYGWVADPLGGVAANLINKRYSRAQESESDRLGIDYMVAAGYDPLGAVQLQEYFAREVEKDTGQQWLNGLFRSHPFSVDRLARNRQYIAQRYPGLAGKQQTVLDFPAAIESLTRSRQAYLLFDQAGQLERDGELAAAIDRYHQALLEAPDEPLIMSSLGLAYLRREDLVPARRYLIKAVNRQGDYYESRLALGYIYLQKRQSSKALLQLETGFKLLPTLEGAYMLAEAREQTGDSVGAQELYRAVVSVDPAGKLGRNASAALKRMEH